MSYLEYAWRKCSDLDISSEESNYHLLDIKSGGTDLIYSIPWIDQVFYSN
ncbi:hypothetical protein [Yeosuana sp.]